MIDKDSFIKMIKALERDEEYKTALNEITRKFEQDNTFCFSNNDFSKAFDILLRHALDNTEWMYDCVWDYIIEGSKGITFYSKQKDGTDKKIICKTAEELYDFFILEEST